MMCSLCVDLTIAAQQPFAKKSCGSKANYWKDTTGLLLWKETNMPGWDCGGGEGDAKKAFKKQVLNPYILFFCNIELMNKIHE